MQNKIEKRMNRLGKFKLPARLAALLLIIGFGCFTSASAKSWNDEESTLPATDSFYENAISGSLWIDENADGVWDQHEQPLVDFAVYLYQEGDDGNSVQYAITDENGLYQLENIEPGWYVVGIAPGFTNNQEYLLPLVGIAGDNCFEMDEEYENAYTELLEIKEDSVIENLNAGMRRPAGIMPLSGSYRVTYSSSGNTIGTYGTLQQAVTACVTGTPCIIAATMDDTNIGATVTIPANKNITLTSYNQAYPVTITQQITGSNNSNNARHFNVEGTLILERITLSGINTAENQSNGGIYVSGELIMQTGAVIEKCKGPQYGGGVYNVGTFTMKGGEIRNNDIAGSTSDHGGGGVYNNGTFIMEGGKIIDNCTDTSIVHGGGVKNYYQGTFTMKNGEIGGNGSSMTIYGGGVSLSAGSTFTMEGGEISSNTARFGGGLYWVSTRTLTINAGVFRNNKATDGGAIYTGNYSYDEPADTGKYSNLQINSRVIFSGNQASQEYAPPSNYSDFTNFDGQLLNNNDINYKASCIVTYVGNNGTAEQTIQTLDRTTVPISVTLMTVNDAGFTMPANTYFHEWNTSADGSGTAYQEGEAISLSTRLTLYAIWKKAEATLQIKKTIDDPSVTAETFLYYLQYQSETGEKIERGFYGVVSIPAGLYSAFVTFDKLEPGIYTITEINSNWQYKLNTSITARKQEIQLTLNTQLIGTAVYVNKKNDTFWITSKSNIINIMNEL